MKLFRIAALPVLAGLFLASQGCVLPGRFNAVKAERDRLSELLTQKDKELSDAQDSFTGSADALRKELETSKSQIPGLQAEIDKLRQAAGKIPPPSPRGSLDKELRALGVGEAHNNRLTLQNSILFDLGSDDLIPKGKAGLDKIAAHFKGRHVMLEIDGHTDRKPVTKEETRKEHTDNVGLSADRALAVYRYLETKGIPEHHMYVRAFGSARPALGGDPKSRRVEIYFIPMGTPEHKATEPKTPPKATTQPKTTPDAKKPADTKKATEPKTGK